jgi:hypothetical protein
MSFCGLLSEFMHARGLGVTEFTARWLAMSNLMVLASSLLCQSGVAPSSRRLSGWRRDDRGPLAADFRPQRSAIKEPPR